MNGTGNPGNHRLPYVEPSANSRVLDMPVSPRDTWLGKKGGGRGTREEVASIYRVLLIC